MVSGSPVYRGPAKPDAKQLRLASDFAINAATKGIVIAGSASQAAIQEKGSRHAKLLSLNEYARCTVLTLHE